MPYRIQPDETIAQGVRRAADEQAGRAIASLRMERGDDPHAALHDARKRFKKIRALLRVVRDDVGEELFDHENVAYRDAGRELSELRDAAVLVETVDRLKARYDDQLYADAFRAARRELLGRCERLAERQLGAEERLERVATTIEACRERIARWPVSENGSATFAEGLERIYRRGHRGFAEAYDTGSVEAFHEWRKRVKYLWYATRILRDAWPPVMVEVADEIHQLSNLLGDDHDLGVFRAVLAETPAAFGDAAALDALHGLAERTSERLREEAHPLATRVYAEEPEALVARVSRCWNARDELRGNRELGQLPG